MEKLFFELIRVAIGNAVCLSHTPTAKEWQMLYEMAKKQSLVGICFAGAQKLIMGHPSLIVNLSEPLRLQWMGMAARIQQRNEVLNIQCVELQGMLTEAGFRSSILKGQGIANLYAINLSLLRQSGDIDIYVDCGREKAVEYAQRIQDEVDWDYKHLHLKVFKGPSAGSGQATEVEMHYRLQVYLNITKNHKLQKLYESVFYRQAVFSQNGNMVTPNLEFNLTYMLLHMYNHLFDEGLGLRQLMDYYFLLKCAFSEEKDHVKIACRKSLMQEFVNTFGLNRFAEAVMFVMSNVFGLPTMDMPFVPNPVEGQWLLNEVMVSGNFSQADSRYAKGGGKKNKMREILMRCWYLKNHYPVDAMNVPLYYVWHWCWKRLHS